MQKEEKLNQIPRPESKEYELVGIESVNFNPHPYMIGARRVAFASDNFNGILSTQAVKEAEEHGIKCGYRGCNLKYEQHTFDTALFIRALVEKDDPSNLENIQDYLESIQSKLKKLKIDGVAFIAYSEGQDEKRE